MTFFLITGTTAKEGLSASFNGGDILLAGCDDGVCGMAAADFEAKPGNYYLSINDNGKAFKRTIRVTKGRFGFERLRLPDKMVDRDKETEERVNMEAEMVKEAFGRPSTTQLWEGPFILPTEGRVTTPFGYRRLINGKTESSHNGMDISAQEGTPVIASNKGKVAIAGDFFLLGRFIILDHGLGIFTVYLHMKDTFVKNGDIVDKGSKIGEVGTTGMSTGPHLHFGIRLGKARVSPNNFIMTMRTVSLTSFR